MTYDDDEPDTDDSADIYRMFAVIALLILGAFLSWQ